MRVKDSSPIDFVSRTNFYEDEEERLSLSEIHPGLEYIARLIMNPLCEKDFAADYFVIVEGIAPVKKRAWIPPIARELVQVKLLPAQEAENDTYAATPEAWPIREDGTLYTHPPVLPKNFGADAGYLLDAFDEFDDAIESLEQQPHDKPLDRQLVLV